MKNLGIIVMLLFAVFVVSCKKYESEYNKTQEVSEFKNVEVICPGGDDEDPLPMLQGTVIDSVSLDSLQGACVHLLTDANVFVSSIGTNINGHYYFNDVANGTYNLVFSKPDYIAKKIPITVSSSAQIIDAQLIYAP